MKLPAVRLRREAPAAAPPASEPPPRRRPWVRRWRRRLPLRRRLWNLLRQDTWLKFVSVLLACFVWYSINELERDAERLVELPVAIRKVPQDLIVTDLSPAKGVTVTLRGPRTILDSVDQEKTRLVVDLSHAGVGRASVDLNRATLAPELPRRLKAVRMSPVRLEVKLERLAKRRLPVVTPLAGEAAVGYTAQITVTPDHVEVTGPASTLKSLTNVSTRRIDVGGLSTAFERNALLEPAGDFVSLVPDRVRVAVRFNESMGAQTFERVPIALRNGRAARIEPPAVTVTIRGPAVALAQWVRPDGAVFVDAAGLGPGTHELPVQVDLPAPLEVATRVPESVRVVVMVSDEGGGD
jgi:YbbR domain-containing protein